MEGGNQDGYGRRCDEAEKEKKGPERRNGGIYSIVTTYFIT